MVDPTGRWGALVAGGLLMVVTHGAVYLKGRSDGSTAIQSRYVQAQAKAVAAMRRGEAAIDRLSYKYSRAAIRQDTENRSIHDVAITLLSRDVHSTICIDADGVGLLDRAHSNANSTSDSSQFADSAARNAEDAEK